MDPASFSNYPAKRPSVFQSIRSHAFILFGFLAVMWALEIWDHVVPVSGLDHYGIRPRSIPGLFGVALAPFLHGGFGHLIANSFPFIILGGIVMLGGLQVFWSVTVFVIAVGGLAIWLVAPDYSIHIGASGLVFGYLGFLLSRGFFERSFFWSLVAIVVLVLYGGLVFGVFPGQQGISWQSHLFGFIAGVLAAWLMFPGGRSLYQQAP